MTSRRTRNRWPNGSSSRRPGISIIKIFLHNWTAVKLRQDFDACCDMLSEVSSGHISTWFYGLGFFNLDGANLQMQTHLVSKIMHQNLAVKLWQFNYGKKSFIVLFPAPPWLWRWRYKAFARCRRSKGLRRSTWRLPRKTCKCRTWPISIPGKNLGKVRIWIKWRPCSGLYLSKQSNIIPKPCRMSVAVEYDCKFSAALVLMPSKFLAHRSAKNQNLASWKYLRYVSSLSFAVVQLPDLVLPIPAVGSSNPISGNFTISFLLGVLKCWHINGPY